MMQADREQSPWSMRLALGDVAETGRRVSLVADAAVRAALAQQAGLRDVGQLEASLEVAPRGRDGLHVTGRVTGRVGQDCVVTLEPMESQIDEAVDVLFLPPDKAAGLIESASDGEGDEGPDVEVLTGDSIDLGALATEFFLLGIDPYPRKDDAEFVAPPSGDDTLHPFAALAALKRDRSAG